MKDNDKRVFFRRWISRDELEQMYGGESLRNKVLRRWALLLLLIATIVFTYMWVTGGQ